MGFTPYAFDDSVTQTEPGRAHVPEGYYLAECTKVEPTPEDYEKTAGFYFHWTFVEGQAGIGRSLRDYNTVGKENAQFSLARTLGAVGEAAVAKALNGQKIDSYAKHAAVARALEGKVKGKKAVLLIADQSGQRGSFSGVEEVLPADDWHTLKQMAVAPRQAAPNGAAPAPAGPVESVDDTIAKMFGG